jgi:uncharacterized repeat protein (TIGR03803 family)
MKHLCHTPLVIAFTLICIGLPPLHAQYQIIHHFDPANEGNMPNGLARDAAGTLYGTTFGLGPAGHGAVFKLDARTNVVTVLHSFTDTPDGANPAAGVTLDLAGNVYGTTSRGGLYGEGTVFKIDSAGVETILHSFGLGKDGNDPTAALIQNSAGNLYGTTSSGGGGHEGIVYLLNTLGAERLLYAFDGPSGSQPHGALTRDSAGNLYGTTVLGGVYNHGTIFEVARDGTETVLHSFSGGTDGDGPYAEPVLDSAGNLYSTTSGGGDFSKGTVFKIDSSGNFTVLHSFNGSDGSGPLAGLVLDAVGKIYGTTRIGGSYNVGVVFMISPAGKETVLHNFAGKLNGDGSYPDSTLVLGPHGTIYGSTRLGTRLDRGSIFSLKP